MKHLNLINLKTGQTKTFVPNSDGEFEINGEYQLPKVILAPCHIENCRFIGREFNAVEENPAALNLAHLPK